MNIVKRILKYLLLLAQVVAHPSSLKEGDVHRWADKELDYLTSLSDEIAKMHEQIMALNEELKEALAMTCKRKCSKREPMI